MIDVTTVSAVVAATSVVVGVAFTLLEIRHMARTRRTEVVMRIYEGFRDREMLEAMARVGAARFKTFDEYREKYDLLDVEQLAVYFEGIGALLEEGLIDIRLVDSLFGPSLRGAWEPMRPVIYGMRERINQPFLFSHFEYLVDRLSAHREEITKKRG